MKFSIALPVDHALHGEEFLGQQAIAVLSRSAEAAGFDALHVTDHPVPTGRWLDAGGHHAQDPFVMLALAGMATTRIRLHTGIVVIPYRNPFLTARAVASLDACTGGRVILGLAAGYMKGEFRALGVPFENRNDLADEYLRAMIAAWTQDEFTFQGTGYEAPGNRILPRPAQRPYPPLWIGGNSRRAMRRAVDFGNAWSPFYAPPVMARTTRTPSMEEASSLPSAIAYMRGYAEQKGIKRLPEIVGDGFGTLRGRSRAAAVDDIARLGAAGMSWVTLQIPASTRAEWCERTQAYGAEIVAALRDA